MRWLINVPCWGERYRRNFIDRSLPALLAALAEAGIQDFRFIVHTDDKWAIGRYLPACPVKWLDVPPGKNAAEKLGNSDRIAIAEAGLGEAIVFVNSDMVMSREALVLAEKRFAEGKLFVTAHSVRTIDSRPPIGVMSRELLNWGWTNRHRWVDDCIYGHGKVGGPAIVVFADQWDVVVHCFSLHSFALHKKRDIQFIGPTADEIIDAFEPHEIHIVTEPDEMAIVEPSPADMAYDTSRWKLSKKRIIRFAPVYASSRMCWQFSHQIVISGSRRPGPVNIVNDILANIDQSRHPARLLPYSDQRNEKDKQIWSVRNVLLWLVPKSVRASIPKNIRAEVLRWI